jgi:hypothetical protein
MTRRRREIDPEDVPAVAAPRAARSAGGHEHDWPHPRVAVGSEVACPADVAALRAEGITHVLDCRTIDALHLYRDTGIDCRHCGTEDDGRRKPDAWFARGVRFALEALRDPQARLLVHCAAGVHRAPSMCYAILRAMGFSAGDARRLIRRARPRAELRYATDAERAVASLAR